MEAAEVTAAPANGMLSGLDQPQASNARWGAAIGGAMGILGTVVVYAREGAGWWASGTASAGPVDLFLAVALVTVCGAIAGGLLGPTIAGPAIAIVRWLRQPVAGGKSGLPWRGWPSAGRPGGLVLMSLATNLLSVGCTILAFFGLPDPLPLLFPASALLSVAGMTGAVWTQRTGSRIGSGAAFASGVAALGAAISLGLWAQTDARRDVVRKKRAAADLRAIVGALNRYRADHGRLPPITIPSPDGRGTLGWRILLLPYLGEAQLFKAFRLGEPWDSPTNARLMECRPRVYAPPPGREPPEPEVTYYDALIGPGGGFAAEDPQAGVPHCALVVEGAKPTLWTPGITSGYASAKLGIPPVGGMFRGPGSWLFDWRCRPGFHAAFADGSVCFFDTRNADPKAIRDAVLGRSDPEMTPGR